MNVLPGSVFNAVDSVQTPGFLGGDNGPAGRRASNAANAVGEMLADRYGGWSNIKNTAATDPALSRAHLQWVEPGWLDPLKPIIEAPRGGRVLLRLGEVRRITPGTTIMGIGPRKPTDELL